MVSPKMRTAEHTDDTEQCVACEALDPLGRSYPAAGAGCVIMELDGGAEAPQTKRVTGVTDRV
jgi:hypothetical protein